jgi:hypothetical protein
MPDTASAARGVYKLRRPCQHRKGLRTFTGIFCALDRGRSPRGRQVSCRPPSSPRHGRRPPRPVAAGRPSSSRSSKSIPSRARPATASCASSVHHAIVGHRPDPRPPPDPRRPRVARRAAEPPINAGPREPWRVTRPAPVRRHRDLRVRTAPHRRPATRRGRLACAAVPPQRPRVPRPDRRPTRPRGTPARWRSRRRPLTSARKAGDRGLYSPLD